MQKRSIKEGAQHPKRLTLRELSHTMPHVTDLRFVKVCKGAPPDMKPLIRLFGSAVLLFLGMNLSLAQQQPPQDKTAEKPKEEKKPPTPEEKIVQTKHSLKIGGQELKYTATAGTILLKLEDGTPKASIFYVAYTKDAVTTQTQRPLTSSFHCSPGPSTV